MDDFSNANYGQQIKDLKKTWIPGVKNHSLYQDIQPPETMPS